jgi:hypothetical protein
VFPSEVTVKDAMDNFNWFRSRCSEGDGGLFVACVSATHRAINRGEVESGTYSARLEDVETLSRVVLKLTTI